MRRLLFWLGAGTLAYTYVVFPLLVLVRAAVRPRPHRVDDSTPEVTMVIAAHNEAASIGAKLENLLSLDYPEDRLEVVIASDGSDDGTADIVQVYAGRGVRLLSLERVGKAEALNAAVAASSGEILVFSDANSIYAPDALRALVRPFADSAVGGVAGDQRYLASDGADAIAAGEQRYWNLDRALKRAESRAGNTISATGAIYAVRRSLFRPVAPAVTDDFYISTGVIAEGYRLVFAPDAAAYEPVATTGELEWERKVRVMTRGLRGVLLRRELLDPKRHGFYAIQLLTHKLLRRTMVFPLALTAATAPLLWRRGRVYRAATVAQTCLYGLGAAGMLLARTPVGRRKAVALPAYFCFVNLASLRAVWNVVRGRRIERWAPQRGNEPKRGAAHALTLGPEDRGRRTILMAPVTSDALEGLSARAARLRGDSSLAPHASIVIPVNAQGDLERVLNVVGDVASYDGAHTFEVVLVINNYPPDEPPQELEAYERAGIRIVAVPNAWRAGEAVCFSARVPGVRAASSDRIILFDADSRLPNPTAVLGWYVDQFAQGAAAAYTHVGHYDVRPMWSVRARVASHHLARWCKRVILRIPTTRGSNYGVDRTVFLPLYERGLLADDLNVGPTVKSAGGRVAYAGSRELRVLTSGRKFQGGWRRLARYLRYRLLYNVRLIRTRGDGPRRRENPYHQRPLR